MAVICRIVSWPLKRAIHHHSMIIISWTVSFSRVLSKTDFNMPAISLGVGLAVSLSTSLKTYAFQVLHLPWFSIAFLADSWVLLNSPIASLADVSSFSTLLFLSLVVLLGSFKAGSFGFFTASGSFFGFFFG